MDNNYGLHFWIPVLISVVTLIWNFIQQIGIEKIRKENHKVLLIHKAQFEKEHEILTEVWDLIMTFKSSQDMFLSKYSFSLADDEWLKSGEFESEISKIGELVNRLEYVYLKIRPFIPMNIHIELRGLLSHIKNEFSMLTQIRKEISLEIMRGAVKGAVDKEKILNFINSQNELITLTSQKIESVSNSIRERLYTQSR